MSKAAKDIEAPSGPLSRIADDDVVHFLTRTLQAHILDAEPQDVVEKLQSLLTALEQQEITLLDWPDSPSKNRICTALVKARTAVSQIVDDLGTAARRPSNGRAAKVM